jgi:Fic family protein
MDGNGRVGRFLMNTMMASDGYPWTVIPVGDRNAYVNALEKASAAEDIAPFANFLAGLVKRRTAGEPLPAVPKASPVDER